MPDIKVSPNVLRGALAETLEDAIARARAHGAPDDAAALIDVSPLVVHVRATVDGVLTEYLRAEPSDFDDGADGLRLAVSALCAAALEQIDEDSKALTLKLLEEKRGTLHVMFDPATGDASVHVIAGGELLTLGAATEKAVTC